MSYLLGHCVSLVRNAVCDLGGNTCRYGPANARARDRARALSIVHQTGTALVPWWLFLALTCVIVCRVGQLVIFNRDRLLIVKLWSHACRIATRRCPTRDTK